MNRTLACTILAGLIGVGCKSTPAPEPAPTSVVMDASSLEQLREAMRAGNANVVVAGVERVLPTDDYLAVAKASVSDFAVGTPVSVIDSNRATIAHGKVVAIVNDEAHIHFTTVGARRPQAGDAVIPFPRNP